MKIMKSAKVKKTTETITSKTDIKGLSVIETIINGKAASIAFSHKNDLNPQLLNIPDGFFGKMKYYTDIYDCIVKIKSIDDLNKWPLYYLYDSGHELFDCNHNIVAITHTISYIGGLSEKVPGDKIYSDLIDKLRKHPFTLNLEEEEMPYYNSSFHGQKGITSGSILLSQGKYEELYEFCKSMEFWSVKMKDAINFGSLLTKINIYGDEIAELHKNYISRNNELNLW